MVNGDSMLTSPFPYFGGKSAIADYVWETIGNVPHYIEPFFGSGAVLLARPGYSPSKNTETICDKDGFVANVWRSIIFSPDETAKWCDWPVNHADLIARKKALIKNENMLLENLCKDEKWHDPLMAGYWIWAASCWIGSGLTSPGKRPHVGDGGSGVHAKGQSPHVSHSGCGVHAKGKIPHVSNGVDDGRFNTKIYERFNALAKRLRYVRVVCGDWSRVCGGNWQDRISPVGIFFDPPYSVDYREQKIYHHDSVTVGKDVEKWCLERGARPGYRIVVAGYSDEYKSLVDAGWKTKSWSAGGGYSNAGKNNNENRHKETLFISPHCPGVKELFSTGVLH